jgi:hypothetical protein
LAALASLALLGCPGASSSPCFGLQLNHTYKVTVEERYDSMSKFTYTTEIASDPGPSCGNTLLIPAGTMLTMTVFKQMSDEACAQSYATVEGMPNVTFVGGFDYDYPGREGLNASGMASVGSCRGGLSVHINAPHQQPETGTLFGRSTPGQIPEVVMEVVYKPVAAPSCALTVCVDYYVVSVLP